ncbi:hypothetical protein [Gorillibacterium massiliense]|uniref:hypothetical protein n=1 Tax=Gorillibacterium massiliense TaxID=1280390 RepID=UPI0004B29BBC|nr:hypothetical protein [Gorillibacterium massiliense]
MTPMDEVNLVASIADLKEFQYQNALMISAIVELLLAKGIISAEEIAERVRRLEEEDTPPDA